MPKIMSLLKDSRNAGINITWIPSRQRLNINGWYISSWYDSFNSIEGKSMFLTDFFTELGITEKDCIKAFTQKK